MPTKMLADERRFSIAAARELLRQGRLGPVVLEADVCTIVFAKMAWRFQEFCETKPVGILIAYAHSSINTTKLLYHEESGWDVSDWLWFWHRCLESLGCWSRTFNNRGMLMEDVAESYDNGCWDGRSWATPGYTPSQATICEKCPSYFSKRGPYWMEVNGKFGGERRDD